MLKAYAHLESGTQDDDSNASTRTVACPGPPHFIRQKTRFVPRMLPARSLQALSHRSAILTCEVLDPFCKAQNAGHPQMLYTGTLHRPQRGLLEAPAGLR